MAIITADVFLLLFAVHVQASSTNAAGVNLKAAQAADTQKPRVTIHVAPAQVRIGDGRPITIDEVKQHFEALEIKPEVRIQIEAGASIRQEHAVFKAVTSAGVASIALAITEDQSHEKH